MNKLEKIIESYGLHTSIPPFKEVPILTPREITLFSIESKNHIRKYGAASLTPNIINPLIEKSFNNGYNGFYIDLKENYTLNNIGGKLKGTIEKPLKIFVNGNLGDGAIKNAENVHLTVTDGVGCSAGYQSTNCKLLIQNSAGWGLGFKSTNLKVYVGGKWPKHKFSEATNPLILDRKEHPDIEKDILEVEQLIDSVSRPKPYGLNTMFTPLSKDHVVKITAHVYKSRDLIYTPTNTIVKALLVSPKMNATPDQLKLYFESGSRQGTLGLWKIPTIVKQDNIIPEQDTMLQLISNQGSYRSTPREEITSIEIPYRDIIPASNPITISDLLETKYFKILEK